MNIEKGERSWLVNEIAEYVYDGFDLIRQQRTLDDVVRMVDRNFHHVVYIREEGHLVGVAIFFMVTDLTLERITFGNLNLKDAKIFEQVEKENGRNMHVFSIRAESMITILKGVRSVLKTINPKTISWFKDIKLENLKMIHGR